MKFNTDIFEAVTLEISEADSGSAGNHALAKVKGVFFVPDGTSRNKRFYPKSLWEKTLSRKEVQEKISAKRMLGTIGHDQVINDTAILEGKVSHIVTKLYIDEKGQGMGEAEILDTPAGRALNTLLKAGSKLFVSSRAMGGFKGERNGLPVVDEDSYGLQTFDFVIDPGFLEANPTLKESIESVFDDNNEIVNNKTTEETGEGNMSDKELANYITEQNATFKKDLESALSENEKLKSELAVANNETNNLREENEELVTVKEELETYKEFGTVEEIKTANEANEAVKAELAEYKAIDTDIEGPSDIVEAIEAASTLIGEYKELGTPESIKECLEKLNEYKSEVDEYGTVEEIEELFNYAKTAIETEKEAKKNEAIKTLATELKVSEEKVSKVYDKLSEEEIKDLFATSEDENTKKLREKLTSDEADLEENADEENSDDERSYRNTATLSERLMTRNFNK